MRDILLTLMVFGAVPWILQRPHIGVLVWSWLAYMNPHRMTWGFAYNLPFSAVTALALFAGFFLSNEKKSFPVLPITVVWIAFVAWLVINTFFAVFPEVALAELKRAFKIQLITLLTLVLMARRERINQLIWVIVVSIGFFGVKGGVFTILTGGRYRVWGPQETFIEGNNEIALALIMIIPLMRYLQLQNTDKWIRRALGLAMILCSFSVVGSYSRGAFLAGAIVLFYFWLKSRRRVAMAIVIAGMVAAAVPFIPEQWYSRMDTINTYEEDRSAMSRINSWHFAFNLANDRPITGGGFGTFDESMFMLYAPDPDTVFDAHSIYFELLAEQGYTGLILFLLLMVMSFGLASKNIRKAKKDKQLMWARDLTAMLQVSLAGYLAGGAFLGLAYFDLPYHLIALIVLTHVVINRDLQETGSDGERKHDYPEPVWRGHMESGGL